MKYINNYEDYIREYKHYINHENSENMNEGVKHWLATFLMLVNLGLVPPTVMASSNDEIKKEFVQDQETIEKVASKFKVYYNQHNFYNTPEYAWEDFQKVYGISDYDITNIVEYINISEDINSEIPKPTNYVNDYAELIPDQEHENELNRIIKEYEESSGMEIAIITINTLGSDAAYMAGFSQDIFDSWGIGKEGADNGILIAISEKDRSWRIQTGYGAEIVLTDAMCSRLGNNVLVPNFRDGNYEKGIIDVVTAIQEHIGYNSADIEQFKEDYKIQKAEKLQKIKDGFLNTITILGLLGLLTWLTIILVRKSKVKAETKARCTEILNDINDLISKLENELGNSKDLEYLKNIKSEYEKYINNIDLPDEPTYKKEIVDGLSEHTRELRRLITKASQFNKYYAEAMGVDGIVKSAKNYLSDIDKINKEISIYGKKSSNNITPEEFDKISNSIKTNMGTEKLFYNMDKIKNLLASVRSSMFSVMGLKENIPTMKNKLSNYKKQVQQWEDDLKHYNISKHIDQMKKYVIKLESTLSLPEKDLFKKFEAYLAIKNFVESVIEEEETRLRRIKEEKERKARRKREEEEAAARRRRNSYSSSSSSYGSSSSSSFGGFGGGSSGGGGAGGRW